MKGFLDEIEVKSIGMFEQELIKEVRDKNSKILDELREKGSLDENLEKLISDLISKVVKTFTKTD